MTKEKNINKLIYYFFFCVKLVKNRMHLFLSFLFQVDITFQNLSTENEEEENFTIWPKKFTYEPLLHPLSQNATQLSLEAGELTVDMTCNTDIVPLL